MSIKNPNWKIFPCVSWAADDPAKPPEKRGKRPLVEHGALEASNDPAVIAAWREEFPDCNWGIPTGANGLAVVDLDSAVAEAAWFDLQLIHGQCPETYTVITPRGKHLYFEGEIKNTAGTATRGLAPGIDTRGEGGYVMAPGSFVNGVTYHAEDPDISIANLPAWIVEASGRKHEAAAAAENVTLDSPTSIARATQRLRDYVARAHVAIEGKGGDERTYAVCCEILNFGLTPDKAFDLIWEHWAPHCKPFNPAWFEGFLRDKITNAAQYAQNDVGAWAVPPVQDRIPEAALSKLLAASRTEPEEPSRFAWMDEDEFSTMKPPEWLLTDIFARDSIAMLYGPSGHYKSFIAMNLAAEVAQRGECAFYVAAEGISRMARKDFPAWKLAYVEERKLPFYLVEDMPLADNDVDYVDFAASIKAKAAGRPVGIIFIDTLNRAMLGLEENSAKDTAKVIQACLFLKKVFRCAVVVVHHTPKDGSDPRGSSALYAGFDTVLKVIADKAVKLVRMFVTKQKTDQEREHPFCWEGKKIGPGLAFLPIENKAAAILSDEGDIYSPKSISACLVKLGAWEPKHVSSHVLLSTLIPQIENETDEQRATTLARAARGLGAAVKKGKLGGYCEGFGRNLKWSLPTAPNTDPEG